MPAREPPCVHSVPHQETCLARHAVQSQFCAAQASADGEEKRARPMNAVPLQRSVCTLGRSPPECGESVCRRAGVMGGGECVIATPTRGVQACHKKVNMRYARQTQQRRQRRYGAFRKVGGIECQRKRAEESQHGPRVQRLPSQPRLRTSSSARRAHRFVTVAQQKAAR